MDNQPQDHFRDATEMVGERERFEAWYDGKYGSSRFDTWCAAKEQAAQEYHENDLANLIKRTTKAFSDAPDKKRIAELERELAEKTQRIAELGKQAARSGQRNILQQEAIDELNFNLAEIKRAGYAPDGHWIAPMELNKSMWDAGSAKSGDDFNTSDRWHAMRDAYLAEKK